VFHFGAAPIAKFRQFYLAGYEFLILGAPVINALAFGALKFNQAVL
jgi:hypothetical protein